jgi:ribosomal protein L34E
MKHRLWIKTRYFTRVPTNAVCIECKSPFHYVKTSKPRKYCSVCAREVQLKRVRMYGQFLRDVERAAREKVSA